MRLTGFAMLLALICVALCGCQVTGEVENQAYVLSLGVDRLENGALGLTARVPQIGKSSPSEGEGDSGGGDYLTFAVSAPSWARALEALQQATPRQMNLSHMELLVVSRSLASEPGFPALMRQIAQVPHLYTTASFVICEESAGDFVEAGETVIGTRMSADLRATLKHYADRGYIPDSSFAEAEYAANSIYSDPVAIWGYIGPAPDADPDGTTLKTPVKQRFSGAALLRKGVFLRALSPDETRLMNLIRGRKKPFLLDREGGDIELTPFSTNRTVTWRGERPRLGLRVKLTAGEALTPSEADRLAQEVKDRLEALLRECQRDECDPFGYGEIAAGHFATVSEWLSCGWRSLYAGADLDVDVELRGGAA